MNLQEALAIYIYLAGRMANWTPDEAKAYEVARAVIEHNARRLIGNRTLYEKYLDGLQSK